MKIEKFSCGDSFRAKYFRGLVTVKGVLEKDNILKVEIDPQEDGRFTWEEDWDLQHTIWGFERGDYCLYKPAPLEKTEFEKAIDNIVRYHTDAAWKEEGEARVGAASEYTISYLDVLMHQAKEAAVKDSIPILNLD